MGVGGWILVTPPNTDASTVIQAALNGLTAGRTLKERVVLQGNFNLSATILIPSYTLLIIDGKLTLNNGVNTSVLQSFTLDTIHNQIEIHGGIIEGNKGNQATGHGIYLYQPNDCTVQGVTVRNCKEFGIFFSWGGEANIHRNWILNNDVTLSGKSGIRIYWNTDHAGTVVANNICQYNVEHGLLLHALYAYTVVGNSLMRNTKSGINVDAGGMGPEGVITGNTISFNTERGILTSNPQGLTIASNELHGNGFEGVLIGAGATGVQVTSNNLRDNSLGNANTYDDIQVLSNGHIIVANTIINHLGNFDDRNGIFINGGNNCLVASNRISGHKTDGIKITSGNLNFLTGNTVTGVTGYGVNITDAASDSNRVKNNDLRGNTAGCINDSGTGTILDVVRASFIKELGTAVWITTAAAPMGIDIDAADEGALAKIKLPSDLQQVVRIKVFGIAQVAEADHMVLTVAAGAGVDTVATPHEAWNAEAIAVAAKPSTTVNFANLDVIQWVFTPADDADIGHLTADDFLQWCCYYNAIVGADCATDLLLAGEGLEIHYV